MKISGSRYTVGKAPEMDYTPNGTVIVKFPAAENENKNTGTKDDPVWETSHTSWFQFAVFGGLAQKFFKEMKEGDSFELLDGWHKVVKNDTGYYNNYVIQDYKKIEKKRK